MLYLNPTPRNAAFALVRTFVHPWDSPALATVVLALAAFGFVQVAWRERRTMVAIVAMTAPYLLFHLVFQDTAFVRYALPHRPAGGVSGRARSGAGIRNGRADCRRGDLDLVGRGGQPGAGRLCRRAESDGSRDCGDACGGRARSGRVRWRCTRRSDGRSRPKTWASSRSCRRRRDSSGSSGRSTGATGTPSRCGCSPIRSARISRSSIRKAGGMSPTSDGRSWPDPRLAACARQPSQWYRLGHAWLVCRRRLGADAGDGGDGGGDGQRTVDRADHGLGSPSARSRASADWRPQSGGGGPAGGALPRHH